MLRDRYKNEISTSSSRAHDLYVVALDSLLAGARAADLHEGVR